MGRPDLDGISTSFAKLNPQEVTTKRPDPADKHMAQSLDLIVTPEY